MSPSIVNHSAAFYQAYAPYSYQHNDCKHVNSKHCKQKRLEQRRGRKRHGRSRSPSSSSFSSPSSPSSPSSESDSTVDIGTKDGKYRLNTIDIKIQNYIRKNFSEVFKRTNKVSLDFMVVRVLRTGRLVSGKPCLDCHRWMRICRILGFKVDVQYSDRQGKICQYHFDTEHYSKLKKFKLGIPDNLVDTT